VAGVVAGNFERMGVTIHRESSLASLRVVDDQVEYVVCSPAGACEPIRVDRALVSVGRVPNTDGLGLADIGVALDRNGAVAGAGTRTSLPHVFAAGDVTADVALVNIAELEGRYAVETMFGYPTRPIRYDALSAIYFLAPEVASVGLNEIAARKQQVPHRVGVLHNSLVSHNIAMRATDGFIKLLVARDTPGKLLGMRVVGPQAATAIQGIAMLMEKDGTLDDIDACVHPHPAVTEGVQECARALLGRSVLKPAAFDPGLLRVDEWLGDEMSRSVLPPPLG
jgi:dihydrolipoamide dehydrogenase